MYQENYFKLKNTINNFSIIDFEVKIDFHRSDLNFNKILFLKLDFIPSNEMFVNSMIGRIDYKNRQNHYSSVNDFKSLKVCEIEARIKESMRKGFVKNVYEITFSPFDMCVLPQNKILLADCDGKLLALYDKYFNLIKIVRKIDRKTIQPTSIAINDEDQLYVSDVERNRIMLLDLDFNLLKSVGTRGNNNDEFCTPFSICYKYHYLYVCDTFNKRIQIYSDQLKYIESINLQIMPFSIQISNTSICINCKYFYDLNTLELIREYDEYYFHRVSEIYSRFYACNFNLNTIYCYDEKGNLSWQIHQQDLEMGNVLPNGKFFILDKYFIITSYTQKKFYKIRF
jgi:hypothetical protein